MLTYLDEIGCKNGSQLCDNFAAFEVDLYFFFDSKGNSCLSAALDIYGASEMDRYRIQSFGTAIGFSMFEQLAVPHNSNKCRIYRHYLI